MFHIQLNKKLVKKREREREREREKEKEKNEKISPSFHVSLAPPILYIAKNYENRNKNQQSFILRLDQLREEKFFKVFIKDTEQNQFFNNIFTSNIIIDG